MLDVAFILPQFDLPQRVSSVEPLGSAGGFSGAAFWRVSSGGASYCLRRWPMEHPSPARLQYIHRVLEQAAKRGLRVLPVPRKTRSQDTFLQAEGHLWELSPWLPGQANYHRHPSEAKLRSALSTLARFHQAACADVPAPKREPSPGMQLRVQRLHALLDGRAAFLANLVERTDEFVLRAHSQEILRQFAIKAPAIAIEIERAQSIAAPLQPCIRDVRHDHMLYTGEEVTGLIDFGAMRDDCVASDIARLLGSMAGDHQSDWSSGLAAYESIRPLDDGLRQLVTAFDRANVLLSGLQWIEWLLVEQRQFPRMDLVTLRLDEIVTRLHAAEPRPA